MKHPLSVLAATAALALTLAACKTRNPGTGPSAGTPQYGRGEYLVQAILWQQHAAEYRALCYQAYNVARDRAIYIKQVSRFAKPPCVVLDIDETVLDNSPYGAWQAKEGQPYSPDTWKEWTAKAAADTVPGALGFLKWASANGIEAFYISNRKTDELGPTIENLRRHGFPYADSAHVLLRAEGTSSGKEARRQKVLETNSIMLLIGDNLGDISEAFDGKSNPDRNAEADRNRTAFGSNWIVLPNSSYGTWEGAMQGYKRLNEAQLDSVRQANLETFK